MILIGAGGFGRFHLTQILDSCRSATKVLAVVEVSEASRQKTADLFAQRKLPCPPFFGSISELLDAQLEPAAALVATPHCFHFENICDCLKAGIPVLVEKPMVLNTAEAKKVIRLRDKTGTPLSVAFPGSYSAAVEKALKLIAAGKIGRVTGIAGHAFQGWKRGTAGKWRQDPKISGGGFLFDTGSHLANTILTLAGQDVAELSAMLDYCGTPVEINAVVNGRFRGGVLFTLIGIGDALHCQSQIRVIGEEGVLQTGMWGEHLSLLTRKSHEFVPVPFRSAPVWKRYLKVLRGTMEDPSPAETGLRFAKLMDAIRKSAAEKNRIKC